MKKSAPEETVQRLLVDNGIPLDFRNEPMLDNIADLFGLCKEECVGVGLHDFKTSKSLVTWSRRFLGTDPII